MPVEQKWCIHEQHAFVLKQYFALKSFTAVCEAFSIAYPDKEVLNKTTVYQLVTKFWDTVVLSVTCAVKMSPFSKI
jgi:hypothetical protein